MKYKLPRTKRTYDDEFDVLFVEEKECGDMVGKDVDGKTILVDPFVGCAWEPERSKELLNKWFRVSGHWYDSKIFLVAEGGITHLDTIGKKIK